jgi:DNA-3-methyladenine glycosylase II
MWFDPAADAVDWSRGERHVARRDPLLRLVVKRVGPCLLKPLPDPFAALVLSVFNQQLSFKGAETLYARFRHRLGEVTPRRVVAALSPDSTRVWPDDDIRHCGISRQKRSYLIDLATRVDRKQLDLPALAEEDDAEVVRRLTEVKGVGVWTAEMYLMFVLLRPDVLPVGDLGLREGLRQVHGLTERPTEKETAELAESWRPWRTVGTWYCWKHKGD